MPAASHSQGLNVDAALLQRHDRPGPRYTSYPTAPQFHAGFGETVYLEALRETAKTSEPLSLYTHLPFCAARCLYCACNVVISPQMEKAEPYLPRLEREIRLVGVHLGEGKRVKQFHFGGGTPTYYRPEQLKGLMGVYREVFDFEQDAELAIEVDPRVTTLEHLEVLAESSFNRLSLGVQDFDMKVQETIRRVQPFEDTARLMARARHLGFGSINIDLIYGLPYQTPQSFARTIEQVIALKPDRLAIYSFAHVPWISPHQKLLPEEALPVGLEKFELLALAREGLLAAGYTDIGMDHFALPEDELALAQREGRLWRNFMGYTTAKAATMVGFGLSAIGYVGGSFAQNFKKLSQYYDALDAGHLPVERGYKLDRDDLVRAHVIREWMCNYVVNKGEVEARFNIDFDAYFAQELKELQDFVAEGFVEDAEDSLRAQPLGRLFTRNVAMVFDKYLRNKTQARPSFSRTV